MIVISKLILVIDTLPLEIYFSVSPVLYIDLR